MLYLPSTNYSAQLRSNFDKVSKKSNPIAQKLCENELNFGV